MKNTTNTVLTNKGKGNKGNGKGKGNKGNGKVIKAEEVKAEVKAEEVKAEEVKAEEVKAEVKAEEVKAEVKAKQEGEEILKKLLQKVVQEEVITEVKAEETNEVIKEVVEENIKKSFTEKELLEKELKSDITLLFPNTVNSDLLTSTTEGKEYYHLAEEYFSLEKVMLGKSTKRWAFYLLNVTPIKPDKTFKFAIVKKDRSGKEDHEVNFHNELDSRTYLELLGSKNAKQAWIMEGIKLQEKQAEWIRKGIANSWSDNSNAKVYISSLTRNYHAKVRDEIPVNKEKIIL